MLYKQMEAEVARMAFDMMVYQRKVNELEAAVNELLIAHAKPEPKKKPSKKPNNVVAMSKAK
jgi:hypothetical protein